LTCGIGVVNGDEERGEIILCCCGGVEANRVVFGGSDMGLNIEGKNNASK
jgi:hypothetical protein